MMRKMLALASAGLVFAGTGIASDVTPAAAPIGAVRVDAAAIELDGHLDEAAWASAPVLERFFEIYPRDRSVPRAPTRARFLFDDRVLYVGIRLSEPDAASLRTAYVDRDDVRGNQDYVEVFLDGFGTGRAAQYFRTNVRGIQTDGLYSEAAASENDAPDFRWEVATSRDARQWTAEFRIPFSSLRYGADHTHWKVLIYRGRPRSDNVQDASAPIPRDASCFACFFTPLEELSPPPPGNLLLLTPEMVVAGHPSGGHADATAGLTAKWRIGDAHVLDFTLNPDFSQVEADAIQVTGNARYALSLAEKRPFFMEGADLLDEQPELDQPVQPVYTRSIVDPDVGLRLTERSESHSYTALLARDSGGGTLLLPGPYSTRELPEERESTALVARYRRNLGGLTLAALVTHREYAGGGFNRVAGMDASWRPTPSDNVSAQLLESTTYDTTGSAAAATIDARRRSATAAYAKWKHLGARWTWDTLVQQVGDDFRADLGFVPAAGYRQLMAEVGRRWFDLGSFSELRPTLGVQTTDALKGGETIARSVSPGLTVSGPRGLYGTIELHMEHARAAANLPLREYRYLRVDLGANPASALPVLQVSGDVGQQLDLATGNIRPGGALSLETKVRPDDTINIDLLLTHAWLRAQPQDRTPHTLLLDQRGVQLTATLHLSVSNQFRLQWYRQRDARPALPTAHSSASSLLFLHRSNWRSAWYMGVSHNDDPQFPTQRGWQLLAKWSYTFGDAGV